MVSIRLDPNLTLVIERSDGQYSTGIVYGDEVVTRYESRFAPWGAGQTSLRNIIAARIDEYDSREAVEELLADAFADRRSELEERL